MHEFNRNRPENDSAEEYVSPPVEFHEAEEQKYFKDNAEPSENGSASRPVRTKKQKQRNTASVISRIISSFAVVATVVVAAVAIGVAGTDAGKAEIVSADVTDTSVSYEVYVEHGEGLSVVLYNDFTSRTDPVGEGSSCGEFTGLKPGVSYTLAVVAQGVFDRITIAEKSVTTDSEPPYQPVSVWRGVTSRCQCGIDGYFHFKMDFTDECGYYSAFFASLKDEYGNISCCHFTQNLHEEQKIDVVIDGGLEGNSATFTLRYSTSDPSAVSGVVEYIFKVKI